MRIFIFAAVLLLNPVEGYKGRSSKVGEKEENNLKKSGGERSGKVFSLFNVVQFQNEACTSQQRLSSSVSPTNTVSTSNRVGTCFTTSQCVEKGGQASGSCAAGFGVCCVFTSIGGSITQNCTYLQNLGFPAALTGTSGVTYTINKCNDKVCSFRLDFETFNTLGPALTTESLGGQCRDTLTFSTSSQTNFPVICGSNTGQHVFLDPGLGTGNTATLNFAFSGAAAANRMWDIKVTQVLCGRNNPPDGCFQYYTGTSGIIMTFNFASGSTHLANQQYTDCIRQSAGFCCVQYQVCNNVPNAFSINQAAAAIFALYLNDGQCVMDFVQISGASATCVASNVNQVSRICGTAFTTLSSIGVIKGIGAGVNIPICDCSQPFDISFVTNALPDVFSATQLSMGVCLMYQQLPCTTTN